MCGVVRQLYKVVEAEQRDDEWRRRHGRVRTRRGTSSKKSRGVVRSGRGCRLCTALRGRVLVTHRLSKNRRLCAGPHSWRHKKKTWMGETCLQRYLSKQPIRHKETKESPLKSRRPIPNKTTEAPFRVFVRRSSESCQGCVSPVGQPRRGFRPVVPEDLEETATCRQLRTFHTLPAPVSRQPRHLNRREEAVLQQRRCAKSGSISLARPSVFPSSNQRQRTRESKAQPRRSHTSPCAAPVRPAFVIWAAIESHPPVGWHSIRRARGSVVKWPSYV